MRDHRRITAFHLADELVVLIYEVTAKFPQEEIYGLTSQMRRAAISVPSNIVEGCARDSDTEYLRFLDIALGSLKELHYQFGLATRLDYVDSSTAGNLEPIFDESEKVLAGLIRALRKPKTTPKP